MKIPVVAPVIFVKPVLPVSVNVAKAPDTAPVKFAVTVPEDATVAVAFIQRDTDAVTLSEQVAGGVRVTGEVTQALLTILLVNVIAPVHARALPLSFAPVNKLIAPVVRILPWKTELVPKSTWPFT